MIERDPRFPNAAPIILTHSGTTCAGWVVGLSNRGAKLLGLRDACFGDVIEMRLGDETIPAIVRWNRTGLTGVQFDVMLGPKMTELMRRFRGPSRRGAKRVGSFGFAELKTDTPDGMQEDAAEFCCELIETDPGPPADASFAFGEPKPCSLSLAERSRSRRRSSEYCTKVTFQGKLHRVRVVNYSREGLCLEGLRAAEPGLSLALPLGNQIIWGSVRWATATSVGVILTQPLAPAQQKFLS